MNGLRILGIIVLSVLAGCMGNPAGGSFDARQLDVFGVTMFSAIDHREINGVRGVDAPCLRGVERSFDSLDVVLGYGTDGRIRKITVRNPRNSMFEIHPGDPVVSAREKARRFGFAEHGSADRFKREDLLLNILVDGGGTLFGLTLEEYPDH